MRSRGTAGFGAVLQADRGRHAPANRIGNGLAQVDASCNGSALIEGRQGIFEVYAGDPIPGLGRVDAIRRQDGKWVVVTTKGLISR